MPQASPAAEQIVVMGRVVAPHGVRGWIKVAPVSASPDALLAHATWRLRPTGASVWREVRRISARMHSGAVLAQLEGVTSREAALALRGASVGVLRSELPRANEGEIYRVDLEGLEVRNRDGALLGTVRDVVEHGAHPLLRVAGAEGAERLIPFVPAIVERVDLEARRIDVDWGVEY